MPTEGISKNSLESFLANEMNLFDQGSRVFFDFLEKRKGKILRRNRFESLREFYLLHELQVQLGCAKTVAAIMRSRNFGLIQQLTDYVATPFSPQSAIYSESLLGIFNMIGKSVFKLPDLALEDIRGQHFGSKLQDFQRAHCWCFDNTSNAIVFGAFFGQQAVAGRLRGAIYECLLEGIPPAGQVEGRQVHEYFTNYCEQFDSRSNKIASEAVSHCISASDKADAIFGMRFYLEAEALYLSRFVNWFKFVGARRKGERKSVEETSRIIAISD